MSPDYEVTPCILSGLMQHHTSQPHGFISVHAWCPVPDTSIVRTCFCLTFSLQIFSHGSRQDQTVDLTAREGRGSGVGVWAPSRKPPLLHHLQIACESIILYNRQSLILLNLALCVSLLSCRRGSRALSVVAGAGFVYIVWLIACKRA